MTTESFMDQGNSKRGEGTASRGRVDCSSEAHRAQDEALDVVVVDSTILGWNSVPATLVAMARSSLWLLKTLTCRARESSGRFTLRPVRMRVLVASSAVTEG